MSASYEEHADGYGPYATSGSYQETHPDRTSKLNPSLSLRISKLRPRILIAGLPGSGKSSVQSVVFHKVSPHETLFLDSTERVHKHEVGNSAFVQLQVWDIPGELGSEEAETNLEGVMRGCSALIFVIDVTSEDTDESLFRLHETIVRAYKANPSVFIEVFIHKADALTEEQKEYCQKELQERVDDELRDTNDKVISRIEYRTTSIFDHSVFEAFSQVVQKLIPEVGALEGMLDLLVNHCVMEKAFLFDVVSKLYIATDSTAYHPQDFELCSDLIEVNIDLSCIYTGARAADHAGTRDGTSASSSAAANGQTAELAFGKGTDTTATIHLGNNMVLYLREVSQYLALVCIIRRQNFDGNVGLIEHNVRTFSEGLEAIIDKRRKASASSSHQDSNGGV